METITNDRDNVMDYIKAFAILLMVFGHGIQMFNGDVFRNNELYYDNRIYQIIYSFHMPIFMLISGYVFYYKNRESSGIIQGLYRYFIPIITFATIRNIISGEFCDIKEFGIKEIYYIFHVLWFLWAIIYSNIAFFIVRYIKKTCMKILGISLVSFFIIFLTPDVMMGDVYKYVIPYFAVGYALNKYNVINRIQSIRYGIILSCIFFGSSWVALLGLYNKKCFIYTSGISILFSKYSLFEQFIIDIYRYSIGLFGSIFFFMFIKIVHHFTTL